MGYFDSIELNQALFKFNGMKILKIESSNDGDEGFTITFENGDVLTAGWSSGYGDVRINNIII